MKLYSKDNITELISSMIKQDRLCHSFILAGEPGVGKKTAAKYIAMQILCKSSTNKPCFECRDCRMANKDAHPDVIYVKASGKQGNYLADDLRPIVSDSLVASNEGGYKIYILSCIDKALPSAQNILLKVFEEPPEHVIFILTADKKEKVLGTILSRAVVINVGECSREDLMSALKENGAIEDEASKCFDLFGGNIGKSLEYLSGGSEIFNSIERISKSLANNDEYSLAKELYISDRSFAVSVCSELIKTVGDACLIKQSAQMYENHANTNAEMLAANIRIHGLVDIYESLNAAIEKLQGNASVILTMCELCAKMKGYAV